MRPKKTILCVDDNEQILSVRTFLLETRGYRVIALADPREALAIVSNSLPGSIDLLLCDLIMPQMDGNELVRRAKQMQPTLPAMIVSGTVTAYDRAGRADVFLPKGACSPGRTARTRPHPGGPQTRSQEDGPVLPLKRPTTMQPRPSPSPPPPRTRPQPRRQTKETRSQCGSLLR